MLLQSRTTAFTLCFSHKGSCCGCSNPFILGELTVTPQFRGKTNCYRTLWRIDLNLISMTILFMIDILRIFQVRFTMTKSHMIEDLFMIYELQNKRACKLEHMLLILCSKLFGCCCCVALSTTTTFHYICFRTFLSKGWEGGLNLNSWQVAKLDLLVGCYGFDGFGPRFLRMSLAPYCIDSACSGRLALFGAWPGPRWF